MATIEELRIADDPQCWAAAGFDVDGDACRIGDVVLRLTGRSPGAGITGWSLRGLAGDGLDGLPTERGATAEPDGSGAAPPHPNGVVAIDHVVAFSPDLDRTVAALQAAGLDLRRIREEPTPAGAPRQAFFRLGSEILEVVQAPRRMLENGGSDGPARLWGLALLVEDIDRSAASVVGAGEPHPAVQPGRRIATLGREAGLAIPVALIDKGEGAI